MAQCKACGGDNPPDVRYCGKCGKPFVAVTAAETAESQPRRGYRTIGLALAGIAAAGTIGYFLGTWLDNPPSTDPAGTNGTATKHKQARAAGPRPASDEATTPEAGDRNWTKMRAEMAACGKFNIFCQEKVRWRYCNGMWGKVPDCPQSSSN